MIDGILPIDKPAGWTSHDVVARVRRLAGQRQVGHAGTLDPLATGVLLLVLGGATRLSSYLMDSPKSYCAEVILGITTVTDDAEAPILEQRDVSHLSRQEVESCLEGFRGDVEQIPPRYAAVRHGGQKLYALARKGVNVEPHERHVVVYELQLVYWKPPRLRLHVRCGSGTYIRSLARDIGRVLEVGGYLHALRRTASGTFHVSECHGMDQLAESRTVQGFVVRAERAVMDWPAVSLTPQEEERVRRGQSVSLGAPLGGRVRLYGPSGELTALATGGGSDVSPFRVFRGEPNAHRH